jgi:hypothetical protein
MTPKKAVYYPIFLTLSYEAKDSPIIFY